MSYDALFTSPRGRAPRGPFIAALAVLVAAVVFYAWLVPGRTAQFCMLVLLYPALMLHAKRLHDMGRSAWVLVAPAALVVIHFGIRLGYFSLGAQMDALVPWATLVVVLAFALWGCVGQAQAGSNRFGAPATA